MAKNKFEIILEKSNLPEEEIDQRFFQALDILLTINDVNNYEKQNSIPRAV